MDTKNSIIKLARGGQIKFPAKDDYASIVVTKGEYGHGDNAIRAYQCHEYVGDYTGDIDALVRMIEHETK